MRIIEVHVRKANAARTRTLTRSVRIGASAREADATVQTRQRIVGVNAVSRWCAEEPPPRRAREQGRDATQAGAAAPRRLMSSATVAGEYVYTLRAPPHGRRRRHVSGAAVLPVGIPPAVWYGQRLIVAWAGRARRR